MIYPLYLTHEELITVSKALQATPDAATVKDKTGLLLKVAEYSEAADTAEKAYIDLYHDQEIFEMYTD